MNIKSDIVAELLVQFLTLVGGIVFSYINLLVDK